MNRKSGSSCWDEGKSPSTRYYEVRRRECDNRRRWEGITVVAGTGPTDVVGECDKKGRVQGDSRRHNCSCFGMIVFKARRTSEQRRQPTVFGQWKRRVERTPRTNREKYRRSGREPPVEKREWPRTGWDKKENLGQLCKAENKGSFLNSGAEKKTGWRCKLTQFVATLAGSRTGGVGGDNF